MRAMTKATGCSLTHHQGNPTDSRARDGGRVSRLRCRALRPAMLSQLCSGAPLRRRRQPGVAGGLGGKMRVLPRRQDELKAIGK